MTGMTPERGETLDEFGQRTQLQEAIEERRVLQREKALLAEQRAELRKLVTADQIRKDLVAAVRESLPLLTVPEPRPARPEGEGVRPRHSWVLVLSDVHLGQRTESQATGGLFEQTSELTRAQFATLDATVRHLWAIAQGAYDVTDVTLLILGDLVEGSGMRVSQATRIDRNVTRQTTEVTGLVAGLIRTLLELCPRVRVHNVGGNHDRISPKPGYAGLGELAATDTYAWIMGETLRELFAPHLEDDQRLQITNWESFFGGALVAGWRFVFEHGASFKTSSGSYGGIGWYPIQAAAGRYQQMLDGADFVVMGHFHRAAVLPLGRGWQVLNGAFPPSTEFVQSHFKTVVDPCQVLLNVHQQHGLVGWQPIYLPHPGLAAPGAFWEALRPGGPGESDG